MTGEPEDQINWQERIIRYDELIPSTHAFIDTRTPGSDKKENFCLIGPGVAEDPGQFVHIRIPHGFNIGGARQPAGCKNSHHSHDTAEVFVVHRGRWKFTWGVDGRDGQAVLESGDTISIPTRVFRGFENVGDDDGFLFAVLGGDDPGHVTWAPYVYEDAQDHGMVLLEDGRLIDTAAGQVIPEDGVRQAAPTAEDVAAFRRMSMDEMAGCVVTQGELQYLETSAMGRLSGVREAAVLGPANEDESTPAGKLHWLHGFHVRRLSLDPGASIPPHRRSEEEVLFVQEGTLTVTIGGASQTLNRGDLITAPIGAERQFDNQAAAPCNLIAVRGSDSPAAPDWAPQ